LQVLANFDHGRALDAVTGFSVDGKTLASCGKDGLVAFWDISGAEPRKQSTVTLEHGLVFPVWNGAPVHVLAFSPDLRHAANGRGDGTVRLWDLGTGKEKANLRNAPGGESIVAFSHDGRTLAAASFRQQANPVSVTLWALNGPAPREVARLPTSQQLYPRRLIFFPGDRRLALLDMYGVVMIWDLVSGQLSHE
jgi:WD40 repeat protein